jgi:putative FmdB family regulatory protein
MPIYEYKCENGHVFEVMRKMSDGPVVSCQTCSAPVQRVFHPVAVHFKGKGFYSTDYGSKRQARELSKAADQGADKHEAESKEKPEKRSKEESKAPATPAKAESGKS